MGSASPRDGDEMSTGDARVGTAVAVPVTRNCALGEALASASSGLLDELLVGHDNRAIATRPRIFQNTVRTPGDSVLTKIGATTGTEAASWAIRTGAAQPAQEAAS